MRGDLLGDLLRQVSRSFYLSLAVLPRSLREPIGLAYLLARAADTVADTRLIAPAERLGHLERLRRAYDGGPADLDALYLALAPRLGTDRLDLIDLRRAGPLLGMAVARTGRPLFEREPGAFREFQSLASRRYCDTDKLRRARRRAIHAFLEREGLA